MRRGGRLFLLLGVVIAAAAALFLFVFLQQGQTLSPDVIPTPTPELRQRVVVARIDIPNNTVLTDTETFLTFEEIPESEYNAAPNRYFTSITELTNKRTLRDIPATDPILSADVAEAGLSLQIPPAQEGEARPKAYPFRVNNLTGVADQIQQGDYVDVIASFEVERPYVRPGVDEEGQPTLVEDTFSGRSTKTLVQNVQVLKILKPRVQVNEQGTPIPAEEAPAADGPPQTDESGQPVGEGGTAADGTTGDTFTTGDWLLILAVTDQEAEVIKFALEDGAGVTLVLRGRGDTAEEQTTGATLDILVSQYGLPLPVPAVEGAEGIETDLDITPAPPQAQPEEPETEPDTTPTPTP